MSNDFTQMTGTEIISGVSTGAFTALDVCEGYLARIDKYNSALNVYTCVTSERARREAAAVDSARAQGQPLPPLAGMPYAVKNLFDLAGEVTLAGAKINESYPPAEHDCAAVARLATAGAICLGATNMGEYAYDFITANAHHGTTANPHDSTRTAGGSSGGSGAGIAAGLANIMLGSDTNGSMRVPAAFCGTWGFKPTYGRISRFGSFPFAGSLDTVGMFGRSVADLAASFDVLGGTDARDPVCTKLPAPTTVTSFEIGLDGLRCARLGGYFSPDGLGAIESCYRAVADALGAVDELELPLPEAARAAAFVITSAEGGALHIDRLRERAHDFDPAMRDRFLAGVLTPASWYLHAQKFRRHWREAIARVFDKVDILVAPVTPMLAPRLDTTSFEWRGKQLPLRPNIGIFTQPITLIGLPVLAAPVYLTGGLPTAVQLIAAPHREDVLLRAGRALERLGICSAPVATGFVGKGTPGF